MRQKRNSVLFLVAALSVLTACWIQFSWMHGLLPQNYFPVF